MGLRSNKNDEASAYNKAGDEAAKQGRTDSAEMFYGLAADVQIEADRPARGGRRNSQRG